MDRGTNPCITPKSLMQGPTFLFEWRRLVLSKDGPPDANTRYVLLALSQHMNRDGGSCFPSGETIAAETRLNERTVRKHLKLADGIWIKRWHESNGKGWRLGHYQAVVPANFGAERSTGPNPDDPESGSGANTHDQESSSVGADRHVLGAVDDDSLVRNEDPTRKPSNSSKNSSKSMRISESVFREGAKHVDSAMERTPRSESSRNTHHICLHEKSRKEQKSVPRGHALEAERVLGIPFWTAIRFGSGYVATGGDPECKDGYLDYVRNLASVVSTESKN